MKRYQKIFFISEIMFLHPLFLLAGIIGYNYYPEFFYLKVINVAILILGLIVILDLLSFVLLSKKEIINNLRFFKKIKSSQVFMGGLEDFIFVLPLLIFNKYVNSWFIMPVFMYLFGLIHNQYNKKIKLIVSLYIPWAFFISSEYGLMTTVCSHSIYNYIKFLIVKYWWLKKDEKYLEKTNKEIYELIGSVKNK